MLKMGNKFRLGCPAEGRRLLWLIAVVFALVLLVQHFELPYGNVFLFLLSAGKAEVASVGNLSVGNSSSSLHSGNLTAASISLNSTNPNTMEGMENVPESSDGKDVKDMHSDANSESGTESDPEDESPSNDFIELNHSSTVVGGSYGQVPNITFRNNSLLDSYMGDILAPTSVEDKTSDVSPLINQQPVNSSTPLASPESIKTNSKTPVPLASPESIKTNSKTPFLSFDPKLPSVDKDESPSGQKNENPGFLNSDLVPSANFTSSNSIHGTEERSKSPQGAVVSLLEMNEKLLLSLTSSRAMKPRWSSSVDQELLHAKSLIENASEVKDDLNLHAPLFRNFSMFKRSYELMEQTLKVYIYKEGEKPIFHQPVLKGIYASEGWFMKQLKASKQFATKNPNRAHLFYLPFSSRMLEETLYVPNSHSSKNLVQYLNNYLNVITSRYRFWNRTGGTDHFLVACHDWAPGETRRIMPRCIRALCNADIKEGFQFGKDVSLPETYIRSAQHPLRQLGGQPPSKRRILAFFAGNMHGYLRPILLKYWENKDPDMKIFGRLPKVKGQMNYVQHMKSSKYCICAKGYEVNSPRVVEAIFYECVPVIISDNFVPPFFETLNWESFAVFVPEKDIPNLKNILLSIPKKKYLEMQKRVRLVQQHFLWHARPVKYDIFNMILHSIWYTRVFQINPR